MASERVRCRLNPVGWVLTLIFGGCGVGIFWLYHVSPPTGSDTIWAVAGVLAFCFVPALLFAGWQLLAETVADEGGIRWRHLLGWRSARWDEVKDYYDKPFPTKNAKQNTLMVIETPSGCPRLSESGWTHVPALRALIMEKATQTRVREWGMWGTRPEETWPLVFHYDTPGNRRGLTVIISVMAVYVSAFLLYSGINLIRTYGTPGWIWSLAGAGVFGLLYFSYGAMLLEVLSQTLETRRRLKQRILVTPTEITLENAPQNVTALWQDVTDYFIN